jgi:hypothetical protein
MLTLKSLARIAQATQDSTIDTESALIAGFYLATMVTDQERKDIATKLEVIKPAIKIAVAAMLES